MKNEQFLVVADESEPLEEFVAAIDRDRLFYDDLVAKFRAGKPLIQDKRAIEKLRERVPKNSAGYELLDKIVQAVSDEEKADSAIATNLQSGGEDQDYEMTKILSEQAMSCVRLDRPAVPIQVEAQSWLFPKGLAEAQRTVPIDELLRVLRIRFSDRGRAVSVMAARLTRIGGMTLRYPCCVVCRSSM